MCIFHKWLKWKEDEEFITEGGYTTVNLKCTCEKCGMIKYTWVVK